MKTRKAMHGRIPAFMRSITATVAVLNCVGCRSVPREPRVNSSALVGTATFDNLMTRALACDKDFVSNVFEMGETGFRMALSRVRKVLASGHVERDSPDQRRLYLWIEALSTFYWPTVYNDYHVRGTYGRLVEECFLDALDNDNPAVHETVMVFLLGKPNAATGPMARRAAALCVADDPVVAELAISFCRIFFFAPEDACGVELTRLRDVSDPDMNLFTTHWRHPPILYAPPTREQLRMIAVTYLPERAPKKPVEAAEESPPTRDACSTPSAQEADEIDVSAIGP